MADRGGIQLLPETRKKIEVKIPGENRLITIGIVLLALAFAIYGGLAYYTSSLSAKTQDLDARIAALNQQRIKTKDADQALVSLGKQSGLISQLLANHLFWTKALVNIENALEPQVRLKTYSASAIKQTVSLGGFASSYSVVARQIAAFAADDALVDIDFKNAKADPLGGVQFNLDLKFDPAKFLKQQQP